MFEFEFIHLIWTVAAVASFVLAGTIKGHSDGEGTE